MSLDEDGVPNDDEVVFDSVADEVVRLRAENERLRAENERLRAELRTVNDELAGLIVQCAEIPADIRAALGIEIDP